MARRRDLPATPILEAVRDGDYAEFTVTLFDAAASGVPLRAELGDGASPRRSNRMGIDKARRPGARGCTRRVGPSARRLAVAPRGGRVVLRESW